jgi:hypothetical protein
MAGPIQFKEVVNEHNSQGSSAERDRVDLARVGKKEVLKVSVPKDMVSSRL